MYKELHARPELSFQEEKTAARLATELANAGFQVTTGIGQRGVVAVLRNGAGPTILVRADMDGLPVKEQTGLSYASTVMAKDAQGKEVPVMHACGHDLHVTCLVGTARVLAALINGGSKPNVIPDEVRLQLTVRTCSEEARRKTLESIKRIARGEAVAAGIPEDRMPEVKHSNEYTPALFNDPLLAEWAARVFRSCIGETNVITRQPGMGGEDFAEYGRVAPRIPSCMFSLGAVKASAIANSERSGTPLPSLHSSFWAPDPEISIKTGVIAMSALVLELAGHKAGSTNAPGGAKPQAKPQDASSTNSWKAGVAATIITPTNALWLAGYAGRTNAAVGKATDLKLTALALEDASGHRAVIVTADLLAIRGSLYLKCLPRFKEKFGLEPAQILLTASHTHCGPMLPNRPGALSAFDPAQQALIEQYADHLSDQIIETTGRALADLEPATLAAAQAQAGFAANRRNNAESERETLAARGALQGPVEHSVPVLTVARPDGQLKAVLFGYACHNTTLTKDFYQWCADYAGFAKAAVEKKHPGATALFVAGCAGDQDPVVRGSIDLAERYGTLLAAAIEEALAAPTSNLPPTLETRMEFVPLNLGPAPTISELKQFENDQTPYVRRWATNLLAQLTAGKSLERTYPYPIQAWQFGGKQLLLTLGGEPVVDYALKFKQEFGPGTWIAGYANDVMCYIPSLRVLNEDKPPRASALWGYEGSDAMKVLGLPALRWADDVEDLITGTARQLVSQSGHP